MNTPTRKFLNAAILSAACVFTSMTATQAATVTVATETGIAMETEFGFRDSTITRGVDLGGAVVTATFAAPDASGALSETQVWQRFNDVNNGIVSSFAFTNGGVNGDGWSLFQGGGASVFIDTPSRIMTSLRIDLSSSLAVNPDPANINVNVLEGASVFDVTGADEDLGSDQSTQGSSFGFPFRFTATALANSDAPTGTVSVLYSGAVSFVGQPALGDLFTTMTVDFTGLTGGGFTGRSEYEADQDTLRVAGDLTPVTPSPVPLPAGLPLLLAGLGGLAVLRRRKRS